MQPSLPSAQEVVSFWRDAGPDKWFRKDEAFDAEFSRRFLRDVVNGDGCAKLSEALSHGASEASA